MIVKLRPAVKNYLWGGDKLNTYYGKRGFQSVAESWELSFCKDGLSTIDGGEYDGKYLCDVTTRADWGENCHEFEFFPVLNKLIDAAKPLSVQVHPDDEYALKNEGQYGKTEMWHILSAENGAYIYLGFNADMTEEIFSRAIADGTVCDYLNKVAVERGQTYFIPSGTVHAIGAGVTLFEVQQNSSLTYRVYDYDRTDKDGKKRELHIEKAKAVCNLKKYTVPNAARGELLGRCKYFSAYRFSGARQVGRRDSFVSLTVTDGHVSLGGISAKKGDTVFMSAGERAYLTGDGSYVLTCVENGEKANKFLRAHKNGAGNIDAAKTVRTFIAEMRAGLAGEKSSLAMLPTYLHENGAVSIGEKYIVIDAGGTNFRSGIGMFTENGVAIEHEKTVPMPATYGRMTADEFYNAIAQNIERLLPEARDIGFCFSFPVRMEVSGDGVILSMPKGIDAPEAVGTKVGERTLKAIEKIDGKKRNIVILNDTAATLLSAANGTVGYIYGTGTNLCCVTDINGSRMLVNTECGNFDKFERGDFETAVAKKTVAPNEYVLEKAVAGKYLADVVAEAFAVAKSENVIDRQTQLPEFTLAELSEFLDGFAGNSNKISAAFINDDDLQTARDIAAGIVDRAAKLGAIANAAAAIFSEKKRVTIVAEGTTFYKLKGYRESFEKHLKAILSEYGIDFDIVQGKGNLCGALAAIAARRGSQTSNQVT